MREYKSTTILDHSKSSSFWHDLDKCAYCLKIFLPQRYEERIRQAHENKKRALEAEQKSSTIREGVKGPKPWRFQKQV